MKSVRENTFYTMHTSTNFTSLFFIIIIVILTAATETTVCNHLLAKGPRGTAQPHYFTPSQASTNHELKHENKPRIFHDIRHTPTIPGELSPSDSRAKPTELSSDKPNSTASYYPPLVERQGLTNLWPYNVSEKPSGLSDDDLVSMAIADFMNVSTVPPRLYHEPGPISNLNSKPNSNTTNHSVIEATSSEPDDDSNQFSKQPSDASKKQTEFITVPGLQRLNTSTTPRSRPILSTYELPTAHPPIGNSTISANSSIIYSSPPPLLLYSIRYEIRSFDLNSSIASKQYSGQIGDGNSALIDQHRLKNSLSKTLIAGLKNAICLDFFYSPQESFLFWIDVSEEKIFRGSISNGIITNVDMIIQGGLSSAEGLAVDWVAKNIYWVESTLDHIEVANLNGSSRRTLIAGNMENPRAISVDPRYGLLFWTDWDKKKPRIERATMSGEGRKTIVDIKEVNGGWPNGLTLDYDALKIYWIDANSDSIHVVDYEGNNPRALLSKIKSLGHPFAITLYDTNLYWTDWKTNSISMASKFDGSEPKAHIQRHQTRLFDIKVFHSSRQPRLEDSSNPCASNNGNCSHLCLLSSNSSRVCACPHLMRLTENNMTCEPYERVLFIGKSNEIRAVDITKPLHHIMAPITVPKVFAPRQFEFDAKSRFIFWADSSTNEVKRASLAGNNIETIIDVIIETPNGIAIDWISGNIYVTSASSTVKSGKVFISNLKGEFISILMDHQQGITSPKSIAVHPMLGLLFCIDENDLGEPLIFMASADGRNKSLIIAKHIDQTLINPVSLAIDFETNRVYWVNQASSLTNSSTIQYYDIAKNRTVTIYSEAELPMDQRIHPGVICVDGDHLMISSRAPSDNIIRANKNNLTERLVYKTQTLDYIMALRVYNASSQVGTNACGSNNGNCSQLCIPINSSERTCKCTMGYNINPSNETECLGKDLFLIYSSNQGMKGISLEPNSSSEDYYLPPIHRAFRASSIDYVFRENLIYWVDNEEGSIIRINRDTTNHQIIIQGLEQEEYIGIDWVAGNIYWLDPYYDVIEVARLNGTNRYVIVSGDIDKANGLVVNPLKGYIVWSDVGSIPKIERARLDGTDRRVIVNTKVAHLDELAIDFVEDYIYWIDSTLSIIERVKPDGTARKIVYNGQQRGSQEHFITMVIYQQYLYVADASYDGSIIRFHKDNTNDSTIIQHNLGDNIKDVTVFAHQPIPRQEDNPCVENNGGCQDLCLFLGEKGRRRCICSHGKLRADGMTCKPHDIFLMYSKLSQIDSLHIQEDQSHNSPYPSITSESRNHIISLTIDYEARRVIYSEMTQNQICSVMFNGSDKRVLVEKQSMVEGIAFDNNQLYWTSIQDNSISRLNTSSTGVLENYCNNSGCRPTTIEKLVKLGPDDKPRGIALDSCTSYVFWTNWNNEASIQRASPSNGYKVESIITTNIKVPNGIAIDQKSRKLYWCDARLDKIEVCDLDGSNRIVLIDAMPQHPFALAVWKNYIFWTDWLARGVFKADKYNGQQAMLIKKVAQRPMGIAVAAPNLHTCPEDLCKFNNGGCPVGFLCVTRETEIGQPQISCLGGPNNPRIPRVNNPHSNITCSHAENATRCWLYQSIIQDKLERFGFTDAPSSSNNSDTSRIQTSTPSTRMIDTSSSSPFKKVHITSSTRPPVTVSTKPSLDPTSARWLDVRHSTKIIPNTTTPMKPTLFDETMRPSQTTPDSQNTSPPSSTSQPCQVTTSAPQTTTTDESSDNICDNRHSFKCYLSEKQLCIAVEKHCDNVNDCPNKEDENDCYVNTPLISEHGTTNWRKYVAVIIIILGAVLSALFLVFGKRNRRRWFVSYSGFSHSKTVEEDGTNIEISNPMFDEDDSVNLVNCPYSIDLNERTTNFSNPLYERQVLLVNDKNPTA